MNSTDFIMAISEKAVYPTQHEPLQIQINALLEGAEPVEVEGTPVAAIVPDTNLLVGGGVAAGVYASLREHRFETVVLISPSHAGTFQRLNICSVDRYATPLGEVEVNDAVRNELCDEDDDIFLDDTGHFHTEGVDVQLPFLQTVFSGFDIVPIVMGEESPDLCRELGAAVGEVMYNRPTLLVATADVIEAREDSMQRLHDALVGLDVSRLMSLLNGPDIVVEGKGAMIVSMLAALHRNANRVTIVKSVAPGEDEPGFVGVIFSRA
jgi:MEMO1 family protein